MKQVTEIISELKATSSKNEKLAILEKNKDNEVLKLVMSTTYSKTLNFFITNLKVDTSEFVGMTPLGNSIDLLVKNISTRIYSGNDAKSYLQQLVTTCEEPVTLLKVINRDLDCGVQVSLINKVWKGLIEKPPYMSYKLFSPELINKIKLPVYSQVKLDGLFADIKIIGDGVVLSSRDGKILDIPLTEALKQDLLNIRDTLGEDIVIHGEGLVKDDSEDNIEGFAPRAIGNGYLNQDSDRIDPTLVHLSVWDVVTIGEYLNGKSATEYENRIQLLEESFSNTSRQINIAEYIICKTYKEIIDHYRGLRKRFFEGSVVKEKSLIWKNGKLNSGGWKLKNEFVADYLIIGTIPHKKNPNLIGALTIQTSDGKLVSDVGSGLTDELRSKPREYFIGKIASIKANDLSYVEGRDTVSLFLPRLAEIRTDKTEADNFEKVMEELDSYINLMLVCIKD